VGIDGVPWLVIDQIGFEHHRLATDIELEKPQSLSENLIKSLRVPLRVQDCDPRSLRAAIDAVFRQEKGSRNGSPGA
jgi:hypothetical protein